MKLKLRILVPAGSGILILAVSLAHFLTPPSPEIPEGPPDRTITTDRVDRIQLDVSALPSAGSIIRHSRTLENGRRQHRIEWLLPDTATPAMIHFLEEDPRVIRYRADRTVSGWHVDAQIADGASDQPAGMADRWDLQLTSSMIRPLPVAPPGGSDPVTTDMRETPSRIDYHGGSGFVRFADGERMHWLWDEEVLRLEHVR